MSSKENQQPDEKCVRPRLLFIDPVRIYFTPLLKLSTTKTTDNEIVLSQKRAKRVIKKADCFAYMKFYDLKSYQIKQIMYKVKLK